MITAKFNLNWQGGEYSNRLHKELQRAVDRSAIMVRDKAKELLNVPGQAAVTPLGLNRARGKNVSKLTTTEKNQRIFSHGLRQVKNIGVAGGIVIQSKDRFGESQLSVKATSRSGKFMAHGGSMGGVDRIYWNNDTRKWTTASAPGTPPHRQSGNLRKIAYEKTHGGLKAKVGPQQGLVYARIQELGGRGMINLPARPYMRPAFESQQQAILFQFALAVQRAAK